MSMSTDNLMDKLLDSGHFRSSSEKDVFTDDVITCLNTMSRVLTVLSKIAIDDDRCWRIETGLMNTVRAMFELGLMTEAMPPMAIENHHRACLEIAKRPCPLPDRTGDLSYMRNDRIVQSWWRRKIWALRHLVSFVRVASLSVEEGVRCDLVDEILEHSRDVLEAYRPEKNSVLGVEKSISYYAQMLHFVEVGTRFERALDTKFFNLLCRYGTDENLAQNSPVFELNFSPNHYMDHAHLKARLEFIDARAMSRCALRNLYSQPIVNHVKKFPDKQPPILKHFFETIFKQNDPEKIEVVLAVLALAFARLSQPERLRFNFPLKHIENEILNLFTHHSKFLRARAMRFMTYWIDVGNHGTRDDLLVRRAINLLLASLLKDDDVTTRIEAVTCLFNFIQNVPSIVEQAISSSDKRAIAMELSKTFRLAPLNTNATLILKSLIHNHRSDLKPIYADIMSTIDEAIREMVQVDAHEKLDLIVLSLDFLGQMIDSAEKKVLAQVEERLIDTMMMIHKQYDYRLCSCAVRLQERLNTKVITRTSRRTYNYVMKLLKEPDDHFTSKPLYQSPDELKCYKTVLRIIKKQETQEISALE